jgi:hypothetical protein
LSSFITFTALSVSLSSVSASAFLSIVTGVVVVVVGGL